MKHGFALVAITIVTALFLTLGSYFISLSTTDIRIARIQASSTQAYYLAEAATSSFLEDLETDTTLSSAFIQGTLTQSTSARTHSNVFAQGDSMDAYAVSNSAGVAIVYARGITTSEGTASVRRLTTTITRALGSAVTDYALLAGGNSEDLELNLDMTVEGGILFANDDVKVSNGAKVTVKSGGETRAHDKIVVDNTSLLTGPKKESATTVLMPAIDFDSNSSTAWRRQATQVLTPPQFNALPSGSILSGIIFVDGSPSDLHKDLTIQGLLVINGSFEVEKPAHLVITAPSSGPAGLLVKSNLEIENNTSIEGLTYASNYLEIEYDDNDTAGPLNVTIRGGIVGRHIVVKRDGTPTVAITITHDSDLIARVLTTGFNTTAPLINIGHWEEEY